MSTTSLFSKSFEFRIGHSRHPTQSRTLTTEQKDDFIRSHHQSQQELDTVLENNIFLSIKMIENAIIKVVVLDSYF